MELMLKYGSSKMVSCSTGRKPVHVKLGETIPEPVKIYPHLFANNINLITNVWVCTDTCIYAHLGALIQNLQV